MPIFPRSPGPGAFWRHPAISGDGPSASTAIPPVTTAVFSELCGAPRVVRVPAVSRDLGLPKQMGEPPISRIARNHGEASGPRARARL